MFSLKIVLHSEITDTDINEIIKIKSIAWPYSYESQLNWLNKNLKAGDLHLVLLESINIVAYLNLINIDLEINDKDIKAFGIGNVCSTEKGKGYGNKLMDLTNNLIKGKCKPAILFCKPELVSFYKKFGWIVIEKRKIKLEFNNQKIETMVFNIDYPVEKIKYSSKSF